MSYRPYKNYSGDPYWMNAKFDGKDSNGKPVKKGDRILYFPNGKKIFTGDEANKEWAAFESAAADESFISGEY